MIKYLLPFIVLLFTACTHPSLPEQVQNQEVVVEEEASLVDLIDLSEKKVKRYIKYYINQLKESDSTTILSTELFSSQLLPRLYKYSNFKPLWLDEKNLEDAMYALQHSVEDGLLPEDYHWKEIDDLFNELIVEDTIRFEQLAKLDILLTDGIIFYAFHLLKGKVNPESLDVNWNYAAKAIPQNGLNMFSEAIKNNEILAKLYEFRPKSKHYSALIEEYRGLSLLGVDSFIQLELDKKKVEIDDESDHIPAIRQRLIDLGDLKDYEFDEANVYDITLEEGVRTFQMRHGLYPDGIIGQSTVDMLNMSLEERKKYIATNLERLRWSQGEILDNTVHVNIATFSLELFREGEVIHRTNVVTGKPYHKTPIFKSKMEYIEFNPTWTVPYSIATNELLPSLKSDKNYLGKNNMELLSQSGDVVDDNNVNFDTYSKSNFPFIIRQKAGKKNALGEVKFIFPNKYSVYLHDTQSKSLFQRTSRAFSHGCIRVENPLDLAEIILNDLDNWNRTKIDSLVETRETKRVNLSYHLIVMLQYYTAGLSSSSTIFYYPDIYDRDAALYNALQEPYSASLEGHQQVFEKIEFDSLDNIMLDMNAL